MPEPARKRHRSSLKAPCLYTLRIDLLPEEIQPTIWRQLVVDGRVSLGRLHHFIQAAMGWHDAHLHEFVIDGTRYAIPHPDPTMVDPEQLDARRVTLNRLLATGDRFRHEYDFGDGWEHRITVEEVISLDHEPANPVWVTDGARACPPEDVGGAGGYQDFLETLLTTPDSEEAQELLDWAGGEFDPECFDRRAANAALQRLLWNGWGGK